MIEEEIEDVEVPQRDFNSPSTFQPFSDNDTATLFQDLERELEKMVKKYHVPHTDLENLLQVVQNLFEMMDNTRDTYEMLEEQKNELEGLWTTEKDKSRKAQMRKLELECRMDEEKQRQEAEKGTLQKDNASLQTKLKQAIKQKSSIEQELNRLKEKTIKDDQARKELLDTYKKQYDKARRSSLQRVASIRSTHRRLPIAPIATWDTSMHRGLKPDRSRTTPDSIQSSDDSFPHSLASGTGSGMSEPLSHGLSQTASSSATAPLSPPHAATLDEELERVGEAGESDEREERTERSEREQSVRSYGGFMESYEEPPMGAQPLLPPTPLPLPPPPRQLSSDVETESEDEGALIAPENTEGLSLEDELMGAVSPDLLAPARAELEMLQKEKESWREEKDWLEKEREEARSTKETLEGQYAQLQVECQQIKSKNEEMNEELLGVKKERDEVLEMYLDQPFDEYCITRKELLDLLRRHHDTTIQLEKANEERERLKNKLLAKKSFFERFRQNMRRWFNRNPASQPSTSSTSSDQCRSYTPSDDQFLDSDRSPPPSPSSPLTRIIAHSLEVTTDKGWLCSRESSVCLEHLPQWMGQISLSGIETDRVDCAALGRVFSSEETIGGQSTPPRSSRYNRRPSSAHSVQQLHAEVWVATIEDSTSFIEIVDILSRTSKVRQRFVVKPSTAHIACMKAIPGSVEESSDFTDSAGIDVDTSWVAETFSPLRLHRSYSDSLAANKVRAWRRGSLSDLSNNTTSLTPPAGRKSIEGTTRLQFTQSLSLPTSTQGQKASNISAVGEVGTSGTSGTSGVSRRLDFSSLAPNTASTVADKNSLSVVGGVSGPDGQPLSQSLNVPVRNQDTILESVDGSRTTPTMFGGNVKEDIRWEVGGGAGRGGAGVGGWNGERGRMGRRRRTSSVMRTVMWIVTEDNRLLFYPTTHPSHIPINSVNLPSRALCIEYIKGKVYIGHAQSEISVFSPDEFMQETWDIQNPDRIILPNPNLAISQDVKCIAAVGNNEIWVGAGSSIFFLDEQTLERRGMKFIDNFEHRPEQIMAVGDLVLVASRTPTLYIFSRDHHDIKRRFDITPVSSLLVSPTKKKAPYRSPASPTYIKCLAMDDKSVFVGTSTGRVVTIPINKLSEKQTAASAPVTPPSPPSPPDSSPPENSKTSPKTSPKIRTKKSLSVSGGVPPRKPPRKGKRSKATQTMDGKKNPLTRVRSSESPHYGGSEENDSSEQDEIESVFLEQSSVSLHCHRDKVRMLLHILLPRTRRDLTASPSNTSGTSGNNCFNSMPNLSSPGYRLPMGQPLFKSLIVSIGKGHTEYSILPPELEQNIEDASARRERNKSFQLMIWGHKNSLP